MGKAQCFVSYCSEDTKAKEVELIIGYLEKLAKKKSYAVDFLFDKNLSVGNDLNKFMDRIKTVDSVIVICSPAYKKRSENTNGTYNTTGVYKETLLIKQRLDELDRLSKDLRNPDRDNLEMFNNRYFEVFPLVLKMKGRKSSNSVPDFLTHLVRQKINDMIIDVGAFENKEQNNKTALSSYKEVFMDIIIKSSIINAKKSKWSDMSKKDLLEKLVYNHKAEYAPTLDSALFVQTYYYDQIHTQDSYFLIGRKGSGKTTAKQYFYSSNADEYKGVIDLQVNKIGIENIFNYLVLAPYDGNINLSNEIENIFSYETVYRFIWYLYIYLYSFYLIASECIREKRYISDKQRKDFGPIITYIKRILIKMHPADKWTNGVDISGILYSHAMERVVNFCNQIIERSRDNEYFVPDIRAQFNCKTLLNTVIGEKKIKSFYRGISDCNKKILLTVDGFEDAFDTFRQGTMSVDYETKRKRGIFQIRWISELMELTHDMKGTGQDPLFNLIQVCFMIPKDQFIEILSFNRDRYKYNTKFCEICWSGIELAIMIRKRLEIIEEVDLSKVGKTPDIILDEVITKAFPDMPRQIVVKTKGGITYNVPIFLYMLRYSFWRPRDLLLELYLMLKILYNHNKSGCPINEATIKAAIKMGSISTVASEFYSEFRILWNDIKDNIEQFKNTKIVLEKDELRSIIMSSKFQIRLSLNDEIIEDFEEKVRFLYEIGFLGILVDESYRSKYQMVTNQGFSFSEGMKCIKGVNTDDFANCHYLINPAFIETLNLDVNTEEYIGILRWEQLKELENRLQISMKTSTFDSIAQYIYKYRSDDKQKQGKNSQSDL